MRWSFIYIDTIQSCNAVDCQQVTGIRPIILQVYKHNGEKTKRDIHVLMSKQNMCCKRTIEV